MLRCVDGTVVPKVSKHNDAFIFSVRQSKKSRLLGIKVKVQKSLETSGSAYPAIESKIPKQLNLLHKVLNRLMCSTTRCLGVHFRLRQRQ
jgi:hypothetical protein